MAKSGESIERDGYYRTTCCNREERFKLGDRTFFLLCKECNKPTCWTYIRPLEPSKRTDVCGQ
jgi:hypothetical protein